MPQAEEEIKDSHVSDSPSRIAGMWKKFHFSGRVIMCSVLFGLGLILIGGLIFAINADDATSQTLKDDDSTVELPTKAPSNYVGPVVMGIGGFIVTVGVIMCMFETQICRKKTADSKPLISDKNEDVEVNISDSTPIPSSSHSHKNHKHKSRKVSASPKKAKSRHAKSQEQKQFSAKSPSISIEKSKNFITSSEEKFLTPPNTLSERSTLERSTSKEVEIQTSSSLMKSFTSSGTWNQSTEFLTPTASYKGNSISVDNSVELDEKQGQDNSKTNDVFTIDYTRPEYMTPLTAEEERIQEMLIYVKNEQMKSDLENSGEKETVVNLNSEHENVTGLIDAESELSKNVENMTNSMNDQSLNANFDILAPKETDKVTQTFNTFEKSEIFDKENTFSENTSSVSKIFSEEETANKNEAACESADITTHAQKNEKEDESTTDIPSLHDSTDENPDSSDSPTLHLKESENILKFNSESSTDKANENNLQLNLEGSASSEETLVSRDNSIEKSEVNEVQTVLSMAVENVPDKSQTSSASESPKADQSSPNHSISDHQNSVTDILKLEKVRATDLTDKESDSKETENIGENSTENSS